MGVITKLLGFGGSKDMGAKVAYDTAKSSADIAREKADLQRKKFINIASKGRSTIMTSGAGIEEAASTVKSTLGGYIA